MSQSNKVHSWVNIHNTNENKRISTDTVTGGEGHMVIIACSDSQLMYTTCEGPNPADQNYWKLYVFDRELQGKNTLYK